MRNLWLGLLLAVGGAAFWKATQIGKQTDGSILIPTGQWLTPAGTAIEVNDRPLGMVLSPDGATLAVATGSNFAPRALHLIDWKTKTLRQTIAAKDTFAGVAFSLAGDKLYVGGGEDNDVKVFERKADGSFETGASIPIPDAAPSGLCLSADGKTLYVALNRKHAVGIVDLATRAVREVEVGTYPYTTLLSRDGRKLYVSNWGGRKPRPGDVTNGAFPVVLDPRTGIPNTGTVSVIDTAGGTVLRHIDTGLHPSAMALSPAGDRLYVTNANSDSITVIGTADDRVAATLPVRLFRKAPLGSSPNALAVSPDGKTLNVANGANNAIAVVDPTRESDAVRGFIPTGWYPTAVTLADSGRQLAIASGYGLGSLAPAKGKGRSYRDRAGVVSLLPVPDASQLSEYSAQVRKNNRAEASATEHAGPEKNIRHVFYIIKENRTYDQLFGDLAQGNGDASLVQFGREVTPNHHALAEQFVLLDNFFAPGDQSALGHRWCTQGYASDWAFKYSNGRNDQNPMLFAPTDFLWDHARANGISARSYGERGLNTITPKNATWSDIYADWKTGARKIGIEPRTLVLGLRPIFAPKYPAFEMRVTDQLRVDAFLEEFREFEKNGELPRLTVLLLSQDHTNGTAPGFPTPRAAVADNDLALGRVVEAISKSRYWKDSVIFVTEDDAQAGTDHVDGHRTVGLAIGPWIRRGAVDSTFYTIIQMFRTIEHILGLAPLNQFDLAAEPMFSVFANQADVRPYTALPNRIPLDEMNPSLRALRGEARQMAEASLKMDWDEPDRADEELMNRAIWHSVKGWGVPFPARARADRAK